MYDYGSTVYSLQPEKMCRVFSPQSTVYSLQPEKMCRVSSSQSTAREDVPARPYALCL